MAKASARIEWAPGPETIAEAIGEWVEEGRQRLSGELEGVGSDMRAYAQVAHPWTNRTGQAEAELDYQLEDGGSTVTLTIYQGAPHGIWLEVRWGGRWGILPETIQQGYGQVMAAVARAFR